MRGLRACEDRFKGGHETMSPGPSLRSESLGPFRCSHPWQQTVGLGEKKPCVYSFARVMRERRDRIQRHRGEKRMLLPAAQFSPKVW